MSFCRSCKGISEDADNKLSSVVCAIYDHFLSFKNREEADDPVALFWPFWLPFFFPLAPEPHVQLFIAFRVQYD